MKSKFSSSAFMQIRWALSFLLLTFLCGCKETKTLNTVSYPHVTDFSLLDQEGRHFQPSKAQPSQFLVLISYVNGCPIVRHQLKEILQVKEKFADQAVFYFINSSSQSRREDLAKETEEFNLPIATLQDDSQMVAKLLGMNRTGEAVILNQRDRAILWRGPVTDRVGYGTQKSDQVARAYLSEALSLLSQGEPAPVPEKEVLGCAITFEHYQPDYITDIAPLLIKKCVFCHTELGPGPWAMADYETIKSWATMMKEVVLTKRMPPWTLDPHIGKFKVDFHLTPEEVAKLITWIDGGRPRGNGKDPLPEASKKAVGTLASFNDWNAGQPDFIVDLPAETIPPTGLLPYRYLMLPLPIEQDTWIHRVDFKIKDLKSIHHMLVHTAPPKYCHLKEASMMGVLSNIVGAYSPGAVFSERPDDHAMLFKKGDCLSVEVHFTTYGKKVENQVSIGFYKYKSGQPKFTYDSVVVDKYDLSIPPQNPNFQVIKEYSVDRDRVMLAAFPHMHLRGKSMRYKVIDENGERLILSVPSFDVNFQPAYGFDPPLKISKGSKIIVEGIYDNSVFNAYNPAPDQLVKWGRAITDEMFYSIFVFSEKVVP